MSVLGSIRFAPINGHQPTGPVGLVRAKGGSDQLVACPVPTYASWRNENPPPSSIAGSEKLAVSWAIVLMAASRSASSRLLKRRHRRGEELEPHVVEHRRKCDLLHHGLDFDFGKSRLN
jgi:hypothetical protein